MELLWPGAGHSIVLNYQGSLDICQTLSGLVLASLEIFFLILFRCKHNYPSPARLLYRDKRIMTYLALPFAQPCKDVEQNTKHNESSLN